MRTILPLAAIAAAIVIAGFIFWLLVSPNGNLAMLPGGQTTSSMYENSAYHYSFSYPSDFEAHQIAPEFVAVGSENASAFTPRADVAVLHAGLEDPLPSYDDFVRLTVQLACKTEAGDCAFSSKEPYTSAKGLSGEVWYLKRGDEKRGPFYTFNISANSQSGKYAVLIVYPPNELPAVKVNPGLMKQIADSLVINKVETRGAQ